MAVTATTTVDIPARRRILIVDDEQSTVHLIKRALERVGLDVLTASDGVEALEKIYSEPVDLVCLDVMMPRMDGFQVLKEIRMNRDYKDLRVVMLTAHAQAKEALEDYCYGADMYLTKPITDREIKALLGFLM